jgi:hypothetical protein
MNRARCLLSVLYANKNNKTKGVINMIAKESNLKYEDSKELSKVSKKGIRVISEMSTSRIIWYVACKHSSGLKTLTIIGLLSYIAYDKVVKFFI